MKSIIMSIVAVTMGVAVGIQSHAQGKGKTNDSEEIVVNMIDAGLATITHDDPDGLLSCKYAYYKGTNIRSGRYAMVKYYGELQPGVKYVIPLDRNSSCDGKGLIGTLNWDAKTSNNFDVYLEDIETGERIVHEYPDGCEYTDYLTSFVTKNYYEGTQFVIKAKRNLGIVSGHVTFSDNTLSGYTVDELCTKFSKHYR